MQHGDIQVRVLLRGEPQKLLTYWRGSLRDHLPTQASVTILRPRPKHQRFRSWYFGDPNFYFEVMTRVEKKRAELNISEKSLMMHPEEIATARDLTEKLFDWLSQRHGIPAVNQPMPSARISLRADGNPEIVKVIESFADPEVLSSAEVGVVYTQGEPRRPDVRWLPAVTTTDKMLAVGHLQTLKSLADGQGTQARSLIDRIANVFLKKLARRKAAINKRITEIFGYGTGLTIDEEPMTDKEIEEDYDDILAWLEGQSKKQKFKNKENVWRGE